MIDRPVPRFRKVKPKFWFLSPMLKVEIDFWCLFNITKFEKIYERIEKIKIFGNSNNKIQKFILSEFNDLLARRSNIFISNMAAPMNRFSIIWTLFLWEKTKQTMMHLSHYSYSVNRAIWKITRNFHKTCQHLSKSKVVLGIETSCDDTGAAVVNTEGQILGEALNSQTKIHVE